MKRRSYKRRSSVMATHPPVRKSKDPKEFGFNTDIRNLVTNWQRLWATQSTAIGDLITENSINLLASFANQVEKYGLSEKQWKITDKVHSAFAAHGIQIPAQKPITVTKPIKSAAAGTYANKPYPKPTLEDQIEDALTRIFLKKNDSALKKHVHTCSNGQKLNVLVIDTLQHLDNCGIACYQNHDTYDDIIPIVNQSERITVTNTDTKATIKFSEYDGLNIRDELEKLREDYPDVLIGGTFINTEFDNIIILIFC